MQMEQEFKPVNNGILLLLFLFHHHDYYYHHHDHRRRLEVFSPPSSLISMSFFFFFSLRKRTRFKEDWEKRRENWGKTFASFCVANLKFSTRCRGNFKWSWEQWLLVQLLVDPVVHLVNAYSFCKPDGWSLLVFRKSITCQETSLPGP